MGNATFGTGATDAGGRVVIGNAGRENGSLVVNGTARISGNTTIGDNEHGAELTLGSEPRGNGRLTVNGDSSFGAGESGRGGSVTIGNATKRNGRLTVNGTTNISGDTNIGNNAQGAQVTIGHADHGNGKLTVNGDASIGASGQGGTVVIGNPDAQNGRLILNGSMATTGNGRFGRVHIDGRSGVISGVGRGSISPDSTDAINGAQIYEERKSLQRGIAGTAALAALHPHDYDEEHPWTLAVGLGHYKAEQAIAVGAFYRPREDFMFSLGVSAAQKSYVVNAGLSIKLGGAPKPRSESMAAKVSLQETQIRAMESRNRALELRNANLEKRNDDLQARLVRLEEIVTRIAPAQVVSHDRSRRSAELLGRANHIRMSVEN